MIKLKKNYTLKTLAKYGFHIGWKTYDNVRIGNHDDGSKISHGSNLWIDSHSFYCDRGIDCLYDLVKHGILIREATE